MKVWFAASEAVPLVKSGGLADVVGALPKALSKLGAEVTVLLPKYGAIPREIVDRAVFLEHFNITLGWRLQYCGLFEAIEDGVRFLLIDNEYFFHRHYLYGYGEEEIERYAFFNFAVLEVLARSAKDKLPDIIHCHDWQTGLIPMLLRTRYSHYPALRHIRTVFTIHNLQYQGVFSRGKLKDVLSAGDDLFTEDGIEFYGDGNCLKAGLRYADKLTTVSPEYAREIQTWEYGEKLDGVLRMRSWDLRGIVNGIDTDSYDPMTDPNVKTHYRYSLAKKRQNKLALQKEIGFEANADRPVVGIVSRMVDQKGFDLIAESLPALMEEDLQLVILGSGDPKYEQLFRQAIEWYPGRLYVWFGFNEGFARRIYAGADMFLMPSRFEPCGLSQLISLRYRTVPIVRETGGLRDTIEAYNEFAGTGNGFSFGPATAHDLIYTVKRALSFYRQPSEWEKIVANGAKKDYGWEASAKEYMQLYCELVN